MTGTLPIAFALVGAIALIIFLFVIHSKRQKAKIQLQMQSLFDQAVQENGLLVSYKEAHPNMILAIDELKMLLLFTRHDNEKATSEVIPLAQVTDCFVKTTGRIIKGSKGTPEEHVDEVSLSFTFAGAADADVQIYKEAQHGLFEKIPMTRLAERWRQRIKDTIIR